MAKKVTQGVRPCQRKGCTEMINETMSAAAKYCSASCRTMQSRQKRREEAKRALEAVTLASAMKSNDSPVFSTETANLRGQDPDFSVELTDLLTLLERQHRSGQETFQRVLTRLRSVLAEQAVLTPTSVSLDARLKVDADREDQLRSELTESHEQIREQQSQLTLHADQEAQLRSELAEAHEHNRQQQSQLTVSAEQEAQLRSELAETHEHNRQQQSQLTVSAEREAQLRSELAEAHGHSRQQQNQLTVSAEREAKLRSELAEAHEHNRQQRSQLTTSAEREAQLRSELAEAHEHNRQQRSQLILHDEHEARLEADRESANLRLQALTAELTLTQGELQAVRSKLTAQEDTKPTSVFLEVATASAEFLSVAEKEALQKVEDMTQWCAGIQASVHRLLPWVSHRSGPVSAWSQANMASRSCWKHPLVPALGAELAPIARRCFGGSGSSVSKSVNQLLPFAVLAAQVYLAAVLGNDKGQRPSDETTLAVVLASIERAPEFYPPTLLGFAKAEPLSAQLATTIAIKLIEQRFSRLYQSQSDSAYAAE